MRRRNGFTLIEIMVVVAIIGTLLGLVSWKILGSQHGANVTATRARMQNIRTALERYKLDQRKYPSSGEGLKALTQVPPNRSDSYIEEEQLNDAWGNPVRYELPGKEGHPYDLVSYGDDGAPGGDKQNADFSCWDGDAVRKP